MKASLQLRAGQNLTIAPQLQQAIRLLQLSSLELHAEVQDALESNMMLEVEEGDIEGPSTENHADNLTAKNDDTDQDMSEKNTDMAQDSIPDELPIDSSWEDIYDGVTSYTKRNSDSNAYEGFENLDTKEKTLREHLEWQLNLMLISDTDKVIALTIIDSLDEDGYLNDPLEDLLATVEDEHLGEIGIEEMEAVLHIIQTLDPPGVGSRDMKECLRIQLNQYDANTDFIKPAQNLVENYLGLLANHDYKQLMRRMVLDQKTLTDVIALIQSMNPRPGNQISQTRTPYIAPDVYVKKVTGVWKVTLNTDTIPHLRINSTYANMIRRADNSTDNHSLKSHLQEARWFIKSIRNRNETLLRVATCIVERQRGFLEHGEEAMKPLILLDVAETLGMHESTISRVTTGKYMHTPKGIFELKYFFSSHVGTHYGGVCSSTAIRALIKKLIGTEAPNKPLSDSKIVTVLSDQGINVARRTIAKYRETMRIPPSNERKRLA